ncbi:hypothetical protein [Spirosoma harenae]
MTRFLLFLGLFCAVFSANAQIDTINTTNLKLNLSAFRETKRTYAVFLKIVLEND